MLSAKMAEVLKIGARLPQEELTRRIRTRLIARLRQGLIREVERLHENGLSWKRLDSFGLEYRYVSRYLRGLIAKQEMIKTLEKEIQRYAKRQITWWKRDKEIVWLTNERDIIQKVKQCVLLS